MTFLARISDPLARAISSSGGALPHGRTLPGIACLFALASAGCFTMTTTEVRVRDASQVSVESTEGATVLPAGGAPEGVVRRGEYWYTLSSVPYELRAKRDPGGAIALHCEACDETIFQMGVQRMELLDDTGKTRRVPSSSVAIGPRSVAVTYGRDACLVQHGGRSRGCEVAADVRLNVPMTEVVEVRRRVEPARPIGYLLLGMSVLAVGAAAVWALTPSHGDSVADRLPWAAGASVPFVFSGALGAWHIVTPAEESVWRPGEGERM